MSLFLNIQSFSSLPTCTAVPSSGPQLINKTYADATYATLAGAVSLSGANVFTGTNTFNTNLPTSTLTPTTATQLITKAYGDATYATLAGAVSLSGANAFTGTNSFNTNLPTSTLTPTTATQLITKAYGDATYATLAGAVSLSGANVFTGTNTFNTNLPTSTLTPTAATQLITKAYGDATYGALAGANTWSAANTFSTNPSFPAGATVGYAAICTNATTGAWAWQALGGSSQATVTTSDATPTSLISIPVTNNSVTTISGIVSAANSTHTDATGGAYTATAINTAGTVTLVNTSLPFVNATSTGNFNVIVSGSNLVVQVTGLAATTYNWKTIYQTVTE